MYADESGDPGLINSPGRYFCLVGMVLHELRWESSLTELIQFRRDVKQSFGIGMRDEFHAFDFINKPGPRLINIRRNDRLAILRTFLDHIAGISDLNVFGVVVDKDSKPVGYDPFEMAWKALIQRFENTISRRNFRGPANSDERGMLFPDRTDDKKLIMQLRKMRRHNPVPHSPVFSARTQGAYRQIPLLQLVEDPNFRDSKHSLFIQAVDTIAYFLYQSFNPCGYVRKKSAQNYFQRLMPILVAHVSSRGDGLVRL